MDWLNSLVEKWEQLRQKLRPGMEKTEAVCRRVGKDVSTICSYMYKLRSIILAAPVAAAAAVLASMNLSKLPQVVEVMKLGFDPKAEDTLFGCLVIGVDYVSRDVAVMGPLALTVACLLLTLCSKRTLYPWLISLFSLALPLLILVTNTLQL